MADEKSIAVLAALPMPIVIVGMSERVLGLNEQARRLIGLDCEGWHYITALRQPALLDAIEATLRDGGRRNARFLGVEGARDTTWAVSIASVALDAGRSVVLTFQDVTAVEEAGQMRRDFVANVSHELRTPLTALLGFVETLRGPAREDVAAQARFLDLMEKEADRMRRLVEDLLSLSRVEDQERVRPKERINLTAILGETVRAMEKRAGNRGIALKLTTPGTDVLVPGDAEQMRQVITNLIENAIKYGRDDSRIDIRLTPPEAEAVLRETGVRLSVTDQGEGIAVHHIARLTERFYRVDTHRSRQVGGTGLGLAIVKHIVNRHRGRLRIESELGKGSCFTVILPAMLEERDQS